MAVPSLPIGISDVVAEHGGAGALSTYLRGGLYVIDGPVANDGVATSLPISLASLAETVATAVNITDHTVTDYVAIVDPEAGITLNHTTGALWHWLRHTGDVDQSPQWNSDIATQPGSDFEVQMAYQSGTHLTTGTEDTYQRLDTTREYRLKGTAVPISVTTGTWLLQIRPYGGGSILDSSTITLTADST